ncbi:DUF6093 family protein [Demequina sp. SO4-18]|uniref:DUF6093 family protein n=1 Tax=Demequina sp. SO4-18 TaxID=3401026 RepID=UPI003B5C5603
MSATSATRSGRRAAERQMTDTWTVYRVEPAWNDTTGDYEDVSTTVYDGPGQWQTFESHEQSPEAGGHSFTVTRSHLKLPFTDTSADVRADDEAVCTASRMDPELVGSKVRIAARSPKTYRTARKFPVEEVQ